MINLLPFATEALRVTILYIVWIFRNWKTKIGSVGSAFWFWDCFPISCNLEDPSVFRSFYHWSLVLQNDNIGRIALPCWSTSRIIEKLSWPLSLQILKQMSKGILYGSVFHVASPCPSSLINTGHVHTAREWVRHRYMHNRRQWSGAIPGPGAVRTVPIPGPAPVQCDIRPFPAPAPDETGLGLTPIVLVAVSVPVSIPVPLSVNTPLRTKCFSMPCSFSVNFTKLYVGGPSPRKASVLTCNFKQECLSALCRASFVDVYLAYLKSNGHLKIVKCIGMY